MVARMAGCVDGISRLGFSSLVNLHLPPFIDIKMEQIESSLCRAISNLHALPCFSDSHSGFPLSFFHFSTLKQIALPENSKVLYKFIVDGNWTTKDSLPTENDGNGNVNNVVHVGPAPTTSEEKKEEPAATLKEAAEGGSIFLCPSLQSSYSVASYLLRVH